MATALLMLHNVFRWIILILLLLSLVNSFTGWRSGRPLRPGDGKLWLFTLISAHINLLLGLYLLLFGRFGILSSGLPQGVKLMKDAFFRFYWVEHPFGMLVSVILITLARGTVRKTLPDPMKYRRAFFLFLFALIIILAVIPWPGRGIVGRPLM